MYDPLIFANNSFSKLIQSINSTRDGFMSHSCARISKLIFLMLRLSIESTLAYTETKRNQLKLILSISGIR
jgi:hypothetical protein